MNIIHSFTDSAFKQYVLENFSQDKKTIQTSDIEKILSLDLSAKKLKNLNGLKYFTSLRSLNCSYNKLQSIDVSHNLQLEELICNENEILSLDLSNNTKLKHLNCGFNRLKKLKLKNNTLLKELICHWNLLTDLSTESNPLLEELDFSYNHIFGIELNKKPYLKHLECSQNGLLDLDLSGCISLQTLRCSNNVLKQLDLQNNKQLEDLRCFYNHISVLDIHQNRLLKKLYCSDNKIAILDTSNNPKLESLDYANNLIKEEDHIIDGIAVFKYDISSSIYAASFVFEDSELYVSTEARTKKEIEKLSSIITKLCKNFVQLNQKALAFIQQKHPDENIKVLKPSDIIFDDEESFRIGYDAGDSPAGRLFIYISFDAKLKMNDDIIYETY
ncbi:leucine-rich repeat domain-containing protein [Flavobacterium procerum]|uniref:Leucine-rich repeat domain-containing protein n=1 Tax=Flavobacterium procerum TaxID=1455569 RepID=A0ABV6BJI1_9FLAO